MKQFQIYANLTINPDHIAAVRKDVKKIEQQLLDAGEWVTVTRARVENADDDTRVRILVEVSGPKCDNATGARAKLIAFADRAVTAYGATFDGLGFALGHTDENIFDERPDLQARPSGASVPEPVSVQLANAKAECDAAKTERDAAKTERDAAITRAMDAEQRRAALGADVDTLSSQLAASQAALAAEIEGRRAAVEAARADAVARAASPNPLES